MELLLRRIVATYRMSDENARGVSSMDFLIEEAEKLLEGGRMMFRYFFEADGRLDVHMFPTFGHAIDAAMMDFSSGMAKPVRVQDFNYADLLDYHDLHWLYSRTWGCEYDRTTGRNIPRRTPADARA